MPAQAEPIPSIFQVRETDGKIKCKICPSASWIFAKNRKKHLDSDTHKRVSTSQPIIAAVAMAQHDYANTQGPPAVLSAAPVPTPRHVPSMSFASDSDNFESTFHDDEANAAYAEAAVAAARTETAAEYQVRLRLALDGLVAGVRGLQMGQDATGGDDYDATVGGSAFDVEGQRSALDAREIETTLLNTAGGRQLADPSSEWYPYDNMTDLLMDILSNLPRLRMSKAQIEMFLFVLEQAGARNVPTMYKLEQLQRELGTMLGERTAQHVSELGNIFYSNDIRATIAMEFANPHIAPHFVFYPVLNAKRISEVWHATRWWDLPPELLTPMAAAGSLHFYVNELCQCADGSFVVPFIWFRDEEKGNDLYGECFRCTMDEESGMHVVALDDSVQVAVADMALPLPALIGEERLPDLHASCITYASPNPLRELAKDDELYTVFVNLWADDVSGNVSKQYNKHINVYVSNMNLPSALLQQEFFVRFFSTSPNASSAEQFSAVKEQVMETHTNPYPCYNAVTRRSCKIRIVAQALPGDNPQQAENCSCQLGQATNNCRRCKNIRRRPRPPKRKKGEPPVVEDKDDVSWYINNYARGESRTVSETLASVRRQLDLACTGNATAVTTEQSKHGVKDPVAQYWVTKLISMARERHDRGEDAEAVAQDLRAWLEKQPGDHYSPLLQWSGLDPHTDTPVEILHTILLGLVRYAWHGLNKGWRENDEALFVVRLESSDIMGLEIDPIRAAYMMQYKNGLIGKHFRAIAQTITFHVHDLCSDEQFSLLKATGLLCAKLWYSEIEDMDEYLRELQILIDNVLDAYAVIDPTRILDKQKIHVLLHIIDDIRRYGPAVRFATEIFESFNAIFRMCSVLSNHQAPSRDIARSIAGMDRLKHILSGGYWYDTEAKVWRQASQNVQAVLRDHPIIQKHLGWKPQSSVAPGYVEPVAAANAVPRALEDEETNVLATSPSVQLRGLSTRSLKWIDGKHVVSSSRDVCKPLAWVVYEPLDQSTSLIGRVKRLSLLDSPSTSSAAPALVTIEKFNIGSRLHPDFDMPMLTAMDPPEVDILPPSAIKFIINVQHDCRTSKCQPTGTRRVQQERETTSRTIPCIEHVPNGRFVVNLHAFHNAALLRKVLPAGLVTTQHTTPNREEWLKKLGSEAQGAAADKSQRAAAKGKATRERNKEAKATQKANQLKRARPEDMDLESEPDAEDETEEQQGQSDAGSDASYTEQVPATRSRPAKRRRKL